MSARTVRRLRDPLALLALVAGVFALDAGLGIVVQRAIDAGFPAWLPTFGTIGQTVVAYSLLGNVYTYLFVPAAAFRLGMRYAGGE